MSLNISLPKDLRARVREYVASGYYSSASEVIREARRFREPS
jgi:putative addiction module CopG family antidote